VVIIGVKFRDSGIENGKKPKMSIINKKSLTGQTTGKSEFVFVDKNTNWRKMLVRKRTSAQLEGYKK
jgi:hypothetical protein